MELLVAAIIMTVILGPVLIYTYNVEEKRRDNPPGWGYRVDHSLEYGLAGLLIAALVGGIILAVLGI